MAGFVPRGIRSQVEGEPAGVEQFGGEPPTDLHLTFVEDHIETRPALSSPIPHGVGAVAGDQRRRVALLVLGRLRQLLSIGVDDEAGNRHVPPRDGIEFVVGPDHRGEQPGADDLMGLGAKVHREGPGKEVGVLLPTGNDHRGHRRGGPGVHDVGIGRETSGLVALRFVEARGGHRRGVDWEAARHRPRSARG